MGGLQADRVDALVGAPATGEVEQGRAYVGVLEVDGVVALGGGHVEPVGLLVDRDDLLRAQDPGAVHGELADRTRAPDGDDVTVLDVAHLGAHVPGRQDVGEEQHLFVGEVRLDLQGVGVGQHHAGVLGLAAGEAAGEVGVAVDPGGGMAEHLLRDAGVGVGVLAARVQLRATGPAGAAGDGEGHDDPVADAQCAVADAGADLDDLAHELVAHDVVLLHGGDVAVEQMEVGAADRRRGDLHDGVATVEDRRVRYLLHLDRVASRPAVRLHARASLGSSSVSGRAGCCGNSSRARLPPGAPSERTTSPVSTICLNRRRSSSSCWCGSSPK